METLVKMAVFLYAILGIIVVLGLWKLVELLLHILHIHVWVG